MSSLKRMVTFAFQYPWEEPELCLLWVEHKSRQHSLKVWVFSFYLNPVTSVESLSVQ